MQLVRPGVAMFDPASGEGDKRREAADRPREVIAYFGVPPEKVIDIQALGRQIPPIMCRARRALA